MSKTKKADAKRAAVYIRVSSEKQATRDKVSLPKQERLCREHAARMGWEVSAVYSDSGISGTKWDKREALMALLADGAAGKFSVMLCYDQDRAARANEGFTRLASAMKKHGLLFACVNGGTTDLTNPSEELTYQVKGAVATFDAQNLTKRMAEARAEYAAKGRWGQSVYILGYDWNRELRRPVLNEQEAEAVREVFRLAVELLPSQTIADRLNRQGIPARGSRGRAALWWGHMIAKMIAEPRYQGDWFTAPGIRVLPEWGPCRILRDEDGKPQRDTSDRLIVEPAAAIVTPKQWQAAQRTLEIHAKTRRPANTGRFLAAGMVRCGLCGARLTTRCVHPKSGGEYMYYACIHHRPRPKGEGYCDLPSVDAKRLDALIREKIEELRRNPALIAEAASLTREANLRRAVEDEKEAYGEVKSCRMRAGRAKAAYEAGIYELPVLEERLAEIAQEEQAAVERLERAQALAQDEKEQEIAFTSTSELLKGFDPAITNPQEDRLLLIRLRAAVTVYGPGRKPLLEWWGTARPALSRNRTVPLWPSG